MAPDPSTTAAPRGGFEPLTPEARRALQEALERRKISEAQPKPPPPPEAGGRGGLDPVRYGDWEKKGIVSDF